MATPRTLITGALRLLGVLASGEVADASQAQDALETLNELLGMWSASDMAVPYAISTAYSVPQGAVGTPSPFILPARPEKILGAFVSIPGQGGNADFQLLPLGDEEYMRIINKVIQGVPTSYWWDQLYPTSSLYFWPVPNVSYTITVRAWNPFLTVPQLDSDLGLPPEYSLAIRHNLALLIAPEYGAQPNPVVVKAAEAGMEAIRRMRPQLTMSVGINGTAAPTMPWWVIKSM